MPSEYFSGKKILEIGPASGHNSLYVAACNPDEFDLLEPNPVAVNELLELYRHFDFLHTRPNVISQTLEKFEKNKTYDVVICEAWLGISDHERRLMKKLAGFVKKGGVLVTTLASPVGYFFNMVRRLLTNQILSISDNFEEKAEKLLIAFTPHLKTLKDMSCPYVDWVHDSLLNPGFLTMHPNPPMFIEDLGQNYSIYNSYPRFSSEWRWYKSLYGENKKINNVFLQNFSENIHNFMDYRFIFNQRSSKLNNELQELCLELRNIVTQLEEERPSNSVSEAAAIIGKVKKNIAGLEGLLVKSIDEVLFIIKNNQIDLKSVSRLKYFKECFGRELLYVSALRDS
ncbi:MAG: class I SAM-dependent methyltransferase [Deltaproteobacteria bacterium]|nr:class I SAM-dependent methyltransferase [Deltaproteobacteria bacterium]